MKVVIFEKDGKNRHAYFGKEYTIKAAKEFIKSFGFKIIHAGGANSIETEDKIFDTGSEYMSADSLTVRFV